MLDFLRRRWPVVAGVVVLLLVVGTAVVVTQRDDSSGDTVVNCLIASETNNLMADADVKRILHDKHRLTVRAEPMGSYDLVRTQTVEMQRKGIDCMLPSSTSAQLVFESLHSPQSGQEFPIYEKASILRSPIVVYAGPEGTDALIRAGVVQERGGRNYIIDMKKLLADYTLNGKTWESLGTPTLRGPIAIGGTDPSKSNSAFTMMQLELSVLSNADPSVSPTFLQAHSTMPELLRLRDAQGLQSRSSDEGFRAWLLNQGELSNPLYAGYESQIIGQVLDYKAKDKKGALQQLTDDVRVLYPDPTVMSDYPLLAFSSGSAELIKAMQDPEIQAIAWSRYGFRSGTEIGQDDIGLFPEIKLADKMRSVAPPVGSVTLMMAGCVQGAVC